MGVDGKPDLDDAFDEERLPARARPHAADAARARMLDRIVPGGVASREPDAAETIGGHRLVRRLGQGGMGDVWEAVAERAEKKETVAIKVLRAAVAAHEPTRKRFLREARTAAAVRHPGIVRIFDVGSTQAGTPYIVMELLHGRALEALLREHGALPWPAAREILMQIAAALDVAHAAGVVHRDLKPANVMVRGDLHEPHCTIIDFGLARREVIASGSESLSRTGEVFGSPPFMSPEQFRGEEVDARSDIYSFGCLMFCVLTGRRPFQGEKLGELMYHHLFSPAPAPAPEAMKCPAALRPALASIVLRALRKSPAHRFASMAELSAALRRLDDDPRPVAVPHEDALPGASLVAPRAHRRLLPWGIAAVAAAAGLFAVLHRPPPPTASTAATPVTPTARSPKPEPAGPRAADMSRSDPVAASDSVTSGSTAQGQAPEPAAGEKASAPDPSAPAKQAVRRSRATKARSTATERRRASTKPEPRTPPETASPAPPADVAGSELPPNPFRAHPADAPTETP